MPVEPFIDYVNGGCKQIEAPAAVPGIVTATAEVNLIGGGMSSGSIIASGVATANRVAAVQGEAPAENEFTETHDECSCPGAVTVNISGDTVGLNPPAGLGSAVCLAVAAMAVTEPGGDTGQLEIWALDTQFLALVVTIKIGSFSFQSDVSFSGPVTPSTLAETIRVDEFIFTTGPGSDPAGTITIEISVA